MYIFNNSERSFVPYGDVIIRRKGAKSAEGTRSLSILLLEGGSRLLSSSNNGVPPVASTCCASRAYFLLRFPIFPSPFIITFFNDNCTFVVIHNAAAAAHRPLKLEPYKEFCVARM
ncbi:uncharacterized protein LOC143422357 [Xylocopa sonorina]|uniref:uncharacterized protein LOC143422357 n=1 Tax=Xylocopa sonorina TaxID=1818115 RepID=UPI00403AF881